MTDTVKSKPILGYWDIRGLAESTKLLLRYVEEDFEEVAYACGSAPDFSPEAWLPNKFSIGLDFPNLPYYIDGNWKITQSAAILEYVADKHGLVPKDCMERAVVHMLQNEIQDFRLAFTHTCYNPDYETVRPKFIETAAVKLQLLSKYLGDRQWLLGDQICFPDFNLGELLNQLCKFEPGILEKHTNLKAYLIRFENLPNLKEYMASEKFKSRPCNYTSAKWR